MLLSPAEDNPIKLADWMELQTIISTTGILPLEEVRSYIDSDGTLAEPKVEPGESSELLVASASAEIRRRARIAKEAYPFKLSNRILYVSLEKKYTPYIFCLLVADREYYSPGEKVSTMLFEHLVCKAMSYYITGNAVRFGVPRDTMPSGIHDAVKELAKMTGNRKMSNGYPINATDKDLGLDVVAWKYFPDHYWGKVEIYVQCTTAQTWDCKKSDCDLEEWRGILYWPFYPIKGLAIPYVVPEDDWENKGAGILLIDRLRIASTLNERKFTNQPFDWWAWCEQRISETSRQS
jgi:hypothetical protein